MFIEFLTKICRVPWNYATNSMRQPAQHAADFCTSEEEDIEEQIARLLVKSKWNSRKECPRHPCSAPEVVEVQAGNELVVFGDEYNDIPFTEVGHDVVRGECRSATRIETDVGDVNAELFRKESRVDPVDQAAAPHQYNLR